jgi:hypothetical protein
MSSPSSLLIKPKPFASLNHLTVPFAIPEHLLFSVKKVTSSNKKAAKLRVFAAFITAKT